MKKLLPLASLMVLAFACHQENGISSMLGTSKLPSTIFEIDPEKDTLLHTPLGATIYIGAGSVQADKPIQLELKEAYHIRDMVAGRLITTSHGQPLSSGGMLYLAPVGKQAVKILKPLIATIPTPFIDRTMVLASRHCRQIGIWKKLFDDHCSICHGVDKDLSGPQLITITDKMKAIDPDYPALLYSWTRNNQAVLASGNEYFNNHLLKWNKTPMNVFPFMTDKDLDALYGYIDHEKMNRRVPIPDYSSTCYDSCLQYYKEKEALKNQIRIFRDTNQEAKTRVVNLKQGVLAGRMWMY